MASEEITQLVHTFCDLLDGESAEALQKWGDLLTEDVEFVTPVSTLSGLDAIKCQREQFWKQFPGLKHKPVRIYVSPDSKTDIVVINTFEFDREGEHVLSWTACEMNLVETEGGYVIRKFQIHLDPTVLGWK